MIIRSADSQGLLLHTLPPMLSGIPTPTHTTSYVVQNYQTLEQFLESLYIMRETHWVLIWNACGHSLVTSLPKRGRARQAASDCNREKDVTNSDCYCEDQTQPNIMFLPTHYSGLFQKCVYIHPAICACWHTGDIEILVIFKVYLKWQFLSEI